MFRRAQPCRRIPRLRRCRHAGGQDGHQSLAVVSNDDRLVFKRHARRDRLFGDREVVGFPRLATIERAAHEDSVARRAMRPVVERAQFVEGDVTDECVALIVECRGDIARHAVILRIDVVGELPRLARVAGVGGMNVVLEDGNDLLRIARIYRNRGFGEKSRSRCESEDLRTGRFGQFLRVGLEGAD